MHTVCFEHKVFSNTCQGDICNADDILPSECSYAAGAGLAPDELCTLARGYSTVSDLPCSFARFGRKQRWLLDFHNSADACVGQWPAPKLIFLL